MILEIRNIDKSFGNKQVLFDVSFDVTASKTMGFLGRNGAGKTTTMRALMDVFKVDRGGFYLNGKPFDPHAVKVGYLPEERGLYNKEPIAEQLRYFGKLKGLTSKAAEASVDAWLQRFDLYETRKQKLETLSKGNQQKIQIAQALLHNPDIIVLDEPFSGLDPLNAQILKDIINDEIQKNKIVIFSSHQMSMVEEFCDEITLIDQGRIILKGNLNTIKQSFGAHKYRLRVKDVSDTEFYQRMNRLDEVIACTQDKESYICEVKDHVNTTMLLQSIMQVGMEVELFMPYYPSLNEIFIMKVREHDETN